MSHSSDQDYQIKPIQMSDLDQVYNIEKTVYEDPWSYDLIKQSLEAPMTYALGIFKNSDCLAYAIFQIIFTEGHILNLAVDANSQRKGLGRKLLNSVIEFGRNRSANSFFLEVRPSNHSAKKLYENYGFQQLFIRPKYYSNGESAIVMSLDLNRP